MTERQSAFESGFLGDAEATTRRTGEYRLGDTAAELLAQQAAPELSPPDEVTIRRRMQAIRRGKQESTSRSPFSGRSYPLAAAAAVVLVAILVVTQLPGDRVSCGQMPGVEILDCGSDGSATLASVRRAFPDGVPMDAFRDRAGIRVQLHQLVTALNSAGARYLIIEPEQKSASQADLTLILETYSETDFDKLQAYLSETSAARPVAQELARVKQQEQPSWNGTSPRHALIPLERAN